jgi:hypothetical protein
MEGATSEEHRRGATAATATLRIELESPLPRALPVGDSTAIFCAGVCFDREQEVELELMVNGVRHRPAASGMPRPDVLAADGDPRSYRSGWWSTVQITAPATPGAVELRAAVRRSGGPEAVVPLGSIPVLAPAPPPATPAVTEDTIAVCMATYNPDPALFAIQVQSLLDQTDERWVCLVSDDCSEDHHFAQITQVVGRDPRFVVSRSDRRLGFYRNFERALQLVPDRVELIALCDQDDRWDPRKLEVLRAQLGDAQLVYSDQRLVAAGGRVLRETMWKGRRNNYTNLASLLIANTITGASTLFRRQVAELALPFPDTPGLQFHDHWLALVALASGGIAYVDRPLYDYVQHAGAIFGEVTSDGARLRAPWWRRGRGGPHSPRGRSPRGRSRGWRAAYFCGYLAREVQAQALLARCSSKLAPTKRRALEHYIDSQRSALSFAWLVLRPLRALTGRNETLGTELELAPGILWRWLIVICAKLSEVSHRRSCDATFPDPLDFEQQRLRRWRART